MSAIIGVHIHVSTSSSDGITALGLATHALAGRPRERRK